MLRRVIFLVATLFPLGGYSYEVVDGSSAVAVADKYYGALKVGDGKTALSFFSPDFKKSGDNWPRLIDSMQRQGGTVTSSELREKSLAAQDDAPCFLLYYSVKRQAENTGTDERLFVCRSSGSGTAWLIAGHAIRRHDNGKSIQAGVLPAGIGVSVP